MSAWIIRAPAGARGALSRLRQVGASSWRRRIARSPQTGQTATSTPVRRSSCCCQPLSSGFGFGGRPGQDRFAQGHHLLPVAVGEQPVVADADEAVRQDVEEEAAQRSCISLPCPAGRISLRKPIGRGWRGWSRKSKTRRRLRGRAVKNLLGAKALLAQHPHTRPERCKTSPAPFVHAVSRELKKLLWEGYAWFVAEFRNAAEKLRAGSPGARFPAGSFPPACPT